MTALCITAQEESSANSHVFTNNDNTRLEIIYVTREAKFAVA